LPFSANLFTVPLFCLICLWSEPVFAQLDMNSPLSGLRPWSLEAGVDGTLTSNNAVNEHYYNSGQHLKATGLASSYRVSEQRWGVGWNVRISRRLSSRFLAGAGLSYHGQLDGSLEVQSAGRSITFRWQQENISPSADLFVEILRQKLFLLQIHVSMGYVWSRLRYMEEIDRADGYVLGGHGLQASLGLRLRFRINRRTFLFGEPSVGMVSVFGYYGQDNQSREGSLYSVTHEQNGTVREVLQFIPDSNTVNLQRNLQDASETGMFTTSLALSLGAGRTF
jgi:hypothetical protein